MEPFQRPSQIEQYRAQLGFDHVGVNRSGKIWYFWRDDWEVLSVIDSIQQVTSIFARCSALERLELWDELQHLREDCLYPWIIGGDFNFKEVVAENWKVDFIGDPMYELQVKLKKQIATLEDIIKVKEIQLELDPSIENRTKLKKHEAELKRFQRLEEEFWKQKSGIRWRRKRLHVSEIEDEQGEVLNSQGQIGDAAVLFFQNQFTENTQNDNFEMLENIPKLITDADNVKMDYERISGQKVNKIKSHFYLHDNSPLCVAIRLRRLTGIRQGNFPFNYLGCPVYCGRGRASYFEDILRKIARRIMSWHNRLLSVGGKLTLIKHVLQSIPIYLLSVTNPPKNIIEQVHQLMTKFLWGGTRDTRGTQWFRWGELCYPREEGGLGLRSLYDINRALVAKLWWNFRVATNSLWVEYMWTKYCKKLHPVIVTNRGASHIWKCMMKMREEVEHDIWWQVKAGNSNFWFDNWTKLGALYFIEDQTDINEELEVKDVIVDGTWDRQKLLNCVSEEMADFIMEKIQPRSDSLLDRPWWTGTSSGEFTVKSAYGALRCKKSKQE
ncbi:hypothetical protein H5410_042072 [Solanum commersonii]|uniref:Uncharacterized protein n=1 Tax=Solanum commersonii TaxID=4109 RepID=A0A9J5XXF3_SOLCO|nr:hypothetical protein H5410_042072 [Solanum commersonii]